MMRQAVAHVNAFFYKDLALEIQDQIDEFYLEGYYLIDIQYFGMKEQDINCHAFLLFEQDENYHEECCYGREMDTECDKETRCPKRSPSCQERGKNSCC